MGLAIVSARFGVYSLFASTALLNYNAKTNSSGLVSFRWLNIRRRQHKKNSYNHRENDFDIEWQPIMSWRRNKFSKWSLFSLKSTLKHITRVNDKIQIFNQLKLIPFDSRNSQRSSHSVDGEKLSTHPKNFIISSSSMYMLVT